MEDDDEKSNKGEKRVEFYLEKNIYFNFIVDDLIAACKVKNGIHGVSVDYQPKNLGDEFNSHIVFNQKSSIKPFNKNEIMIDKDYQLRENMDEYEILKDQYDLSDLEDDNVDNLTSSLRGSVDKSTNSSINASLRNSCNQSIYNSIRESTNNTGQGIIRRLRAAFQESVNEDL